MEVAGGGFAGFVVEPDAEEGAGGYGRAVGEGPARRVGEGIGEPQARKIGGGGGRVVEFDERRGFTGVVEDRCVRLRDDFVDPDPGERGQRGAGGVGSAGGDSVGGVGGGGSPVGGAARVLRRVDQLKRRSEAVRVGGPGMAIEVTHFAEGDFGVGRQQAQAFAVVVQVAGEFTEDSDAGAEAGSEGGGIGGKDEIAVGRDGGVGGKGVAQSVETIAGEVERNAGVAVVEFDERGAGFGRVVVNLIEDNPVPCLGNGSGVDDADGVDISKGLARAVESDQAEVVGGAGERDADGEGSNGGPGDGQSEAVDLDVSDAEGGGAGEGDGGGGGGEVGAAVGRDGEGGRV